MEHATGREIKEHIRQKVFSLKERVLLAKDWDEHLRIVSKIEALNGLMADFEPQPEEVERTRTALNL